MATRPRKRCMKCRQMLSYSAYMRHQNPLICKDIVPLKVSVVENETVHDQHGSTNAQPSPSLNNTTHNLDSVPPSSLCTNNFDSTSDENLGVEVDDQENAVDSGESDVSEVDDDGIEILSQEECDSLPQNEYLASSSTETDTYSGILLFICFFVSFFQICYKASDRAINLLLVFIRCLLSWISFIVPHPAKAIVEKIASSIPRNVYFLKKMFSSGSTVKTYIVCPKCCHLYSRDKFRNISSTTITIEIPKCTMSENTNRKCNTLLFKKVKQGMNYKLIPRKIYAYYSLKDSLAKLYSKKNFHQNCELWRKRQPVPDVYTDIYDGKIWKEFMQIDNKPFLSAPYNLSLKLNVDWIQPFDHTQYSMGIIYMVVENLPRSERFKVENVLLVGCIPGPSEPKLNINSFLSPLVDELLEFWDGVQLKTSCLFRLVSVRCALTCITCDLPATRKVCGFMGHAAAMGCSKCKKKFKSASFGDKLDYSGYSRESWVLRDKQSHADAILAVNQAKTATEKKQLEKEHGVRYSTLLRLPYFDIVRCHCIDAMHNLLLGTAKNLLSVWITSGIISQTDLDKIQEKVDKMSTPSGVGRLPQKISYHSSFTADQWRNWVCLFSLYCLHDNLPSAHYNCLVIFVQACTLVLQPVITLGEINKADNLLIQFCCKFQELYGKDKCTPNMHLHCHLCETIRDYGPVYASWCFAFERFNGIFESFQKNWIHPELQLANKFIRFQEMANLDMPFTLPPNLTDILQAHSTKIKDVVQGQGGLLATHVDSSLLLSYMKNISCAVNEIDASEQEFQHVTGKVYERMFHPEEVQWLQEVYVLLYPHETSLHVSMLCETFHEFSVLGEHFSSEKRKGSASSCVSAYWAGPVGSLSTTTDSIRSGVIEYFFRHTICITSLSDQSKRQRISHIFARIRWYKVHPKESWFPIPLSVVCSDYDALGPSSFMPIARIKSRCAISHDVIKFDTGEDSVVIVSPLTKKLSI